MNTAVSIPDDDFDWFERVAARLGLNRSEFYRLAGTKHADEYEGGSELSALANAAIERARRSHGDDLFVCESQRLMTERAEW